MSEKLAFLSKRLKIELAKRYPHKYPKTYIDNVLRKMLQESKFRRRKAWRRLPDKIKLILSDILKESGYRGRAMDYWDKTQRKKGFKKNPNGGTMRISQTQMLLALLVIGVGGVYYYKQQQAKKIAAAIKTAAPAGGLYAAPPTFEQNLPSYSIPSMPGDTMVSGYNQLG